jgi:hypothetical protein
VGFLDSLLGRTKPVQANLDALFELPSAAVTLQAATDLVPTGTGSVCFSTVEGRSFSDVETEVRQLIDGTLGEGASAVQVTRDSYGYTWLTITKPADQIADLVTDVHAVNSSLADNGFGPYLLCSLIVFRNASAKLALVYLYKRGTFYPFAPQGANRRDNALELQVKAAIGTDLKFEPELGRWFAVYGAPGL